MKTHTLLCGALLGAFSLSVFAADPVSPPAAAPAGAPAPVVSSAPATASGVRGEIMPLFNQARTKRRAGKTSPADFAEELAAFDAIYAKAKANNREEAADVLYALSAFHGQILGDMKKGQELLDRVVAEYAGTKAANDAKRTIDSLARRADANKVSSALEGKVAPELNFKWTSQGDFKTLSDLKGKVVLLDFWATWCGPCIASFPSLREVAAHFKDKPVVILGVTSLQGRVSNLEAKPIDTRSDPAREMALMTDFMKKKEMTWTVAFSEEKVFNPDYGVTGIPHLALIGPDGRVRSGNLHGTPKRELINRIEALLKETPAPKP